MLGQPVIPDYVRFGSQLYYVTWPRLVIICVSALLLIMGVSELQEHLPVESDLAADKAGVLGSGDPPRYSGDGGGIRGLLGKAASRLTAGHGAGKSGKAGKAAKPGAPAALPSVMPSWCASKGSLYYLDKWKLAYIGRDSHYPDTDPGNPAAAAPAEPAKDPGGQLLCDWVPISKVKVEYPFSLCTYDKAVDSQISAHIHKDGVWNNGKRELLELLLPRVNEMMEMPERTMVIDVGANVGFYSLLSASRGYDVVAVEPAHESVLRLLHSLAANGVKIARNGKDAGINSGHTRMPIAYVYENAASDVYNTAQLRYDSGNPGASWVEETETPRRAVTTVVLDDLLDGQFRDRGAGKRPDVATAGVIVPTRVRLLKISAEGFDSRALHGARRLLSLGRVPYIHFVFNADHVRGHGCDAKALILALFADGYRLYHGSVYIYREKELASFLRNIAGVGGAGAPARSTELLFVRAGAPFII